MNKLIYVRNDGKRRHINTSDYVYHLMGNTHHGDTQGCHTRSHENGFICTRKFGHSGPHLAIISDTRYICAIWQNGAQP